MKKSEFNKFIKEEVYSTLNEEEGVSSQPLQTGDIVTVPPNLTTDPINMQGEEGELVLIDDGKLHLKVVSTNGNDEVRATIISGGTLSSKKGVNLPNTKISLPCLTPKDLRDLDFVLENDFDWVGLSFVRSVTDIVELKEIIKHKGKKTRVIAKIEKPEAVREIDNIIDVTDGLMVARGDLGVELPMEEVPMLQKMIVNMEFPVDRLIQFIGQYNNFIDLGGKFYEKFKIILNSYENEKQCETKLPLEYKKLKSDIDIAIEKFNKAYKPVEINGSKMKELLYGLNEFE